MTEPERDPQVANEARYPNNGTVEAYALLTSRIQPFLCPPPPVMQIMCTQSLEPLVLGVCSGTRRALSPLYIYTRKSDFPCSIPPRHRRIVLEIVISIFLFFKPPSVARVGEKRKSGIFLREFNGV